MLIDLRFTLFNTCDKQQPNDIKYYLFVRQRKICVFKLRLITILFNSVRTCPEKLQALIIGFNEAFT